jgi:hypothetical protein
LITYWVDRAGQFGIEDYLADRGQALRDQFAVRPYAWDAGAWQVPAGPQIFAALDQLSPAQREGVSALRDQLAAVLPNALLLNDPTRCLLRPALLAALAEAGINDFRAYPPHEAGQIRHWPVFVRGALNHDGSLTPLLGSAGELRRALRALRLRGHRLGDLLVVEFCDTSDGQGLFRKYSAYLVGQAVVPAHLMAGRAWIMKSESAERTLELVREDAAYIEQNPHEAWVREVFALAGVQFGRLDYGVLRGRPQAWEINLNPTMGRSPGKPRRAMDPPVREVWEASRQLAHQRLRAAFAGLDRRGRPAPIALQLPAELTARIAAAGRREQRARARRDLLGRLYRSPLGAPLRAATRVIRGFI